MINLARDRHLLDDPYAVSLWIDPDRKIITFSRGKLLFVFNFLGAWFGISLEITWLSAIVTGVFGIPGVVVLLILTYLL